jgi:hypothetical protein
MKKTTSIEMASVLGLYLKRWQRWADESLGITIKLHYDPQTLSQKDLRLIGK